MTQPALARTLSRGMRTYRWPPGSDEDTCEFEVGGVTSILSNGIPKPFLIGWAAKKAAECAVDDHELIGAMLAKKGGERMAVDHIKGSRFRDMGEKADRGTVVHAAIEAYLAGKAPTKSELEEQLAEARVDRSMWKSAAGMVAAGMEFLFGQEPDVIRTESTAFSRTHGYAGTFDLLAKMRVGKSTRTVVVDFKTSPRIYDETGLQLCAYSRTDFIGLNDGTEVKMPKNIRDGIAVCLKASGKYEPVAFTLTDELFDVFLAARAIAMSSGVVAGARRPSF